MVLDRISTLRATAHKSSIHETRTATTLSKVCGRRAFPNRYVCSRAYRHLRAGVTWSQTLFVCIDVSRAASRADETRPPWPSVVAAVGGAGLVVMFLVAGSGEWGPPGKEAYASYQMMNRLVAIPAALLVVGVFATGLRSIRSLTGLGWVSWLLGLAGSLLVLAGNVAEFWLFTSRAYGDPARALAWGSFTLGVVLLLIAGILGAVRANRSKPVRELTRS